jgi:D-glycero-alpha-D-manno-heptose 1-phosphate guanylyltransferase
MIFILATNKPGSSLSLALKPMENFDRYGVVKTDDHDRIISFEEKKFYEKGNINGGIYLLNRNLFSDKNLPQKFPSRRR